MMKYVELNRETFSKTIDNIQQQSLRDEKIAIELSWGYDSNLGSVGASETDFDYQLTNIIQEVSMEDYKFKVISDEPSLLIFELFRQMDEALGISEKIQNGEIQFFLKQIWCQIHEDRDDLSFVGVPSSEIYLLIYESI